MGSGPSRAEDEGRRIELPLMDLRHALAQRLPRKSRQSTVPARMLRETANQKGDISINYTVYGRLENHQPFLNPEILEHFLPFAFDCLPKMMEVCGHWFVTLNDFVLMRWANGMISGFKKRYAQYLRLEKVTISHQPLFTEDFGIRVDILLYARILPDCRGNCLEVAYVADTLPPPRQNTTASSDSPIRPSSCPTPRNRAAFRFEAIRQGASRTVWLRQDRPKFHGDEIHVVGSANVPTVCVGDWIEIPVNLCNALGVTDPFSFQWLAPKCIVNERDRQFGQKCLLDGDTIQWYDYDTFVAQSQEPISKLDSFRPQWRLVQAEYSGVNLIISRNRFDVEETGNVKASPGALGVYYKVAREKEAIVIPLKRLGLEHDRFSNHQIRQKDRVILFVVQGGPDAP